MRASTMIVLVWKHLRPRLLLRNITMAAVCKEDAEYQKTVAALNDLQTNAAVLEQVRRERKARQRSAELIKMHQYLERTGLKVEDLDRMNAIHVTGTKGKGSVCAMTESILRAHGLKTGFYSSPHLLEVRERIRINGQPLSKAQFSSYFWDCHNKLTSTKEQYSGTMPAYFRFLTVMAFNVFLREKVDVAVVEVGIGGTYDSTNIIPNPRVCAITSLGYDHVEVLGETLAKIAWQKGGICKPGHPTFTLPQLSEPLKALAERAQELKASSFHVVPELSEYPGQQAELGVPGEHQQMNASLAVQVCRAWLQEMEKWNKMNGTNVERTLEGVPVADTFHLPPEFREGLRLCCWAGRNQIVRHRGVTYFLDGAHTPDSVKASAEWFVKAAGEEAQSIEYVGPARGSVVRVMLFNLTGRRDNRTLIQPLMRCGVHYAVFCPNIAHSNLTNSADMTNLRVTVDDQFARCKAIEQTWLQLHTEQQPFTKLTNESGPGDHVTLPRTTVFSCVDHALHWITSGRDPALPRPSDDLTAPHPLPPDIANATHIQLLVTGSLHLVGAVMSVMGYTVDDV